MEENKVVITLSEYIRLYESQKEKNLELNMILELIFNDTELTNDGNNLKFDYYNSKLMGYLKEHYPEKYEKQIKYLKEDYE